MSRLTADSSYWSCAIRKSEGRDIGHKCKECKQAFNKIGEEIVMRRGGRIEMRYHRNCFSDQADPRSQKCGTFQSGSWAHSQSPAAPTQVYKKMRTSSHW